MQHDPKFALNLFASWSNSYHTGQTDLNMSSNKILNINALFPSQKSQDIPATIFELFEMPLINGNPNGHHSNKDEVWINLVTFPHSLRFLNNNGIIW